MDKKSKKLKETVNPKETSTTKVGQKQTKCVKFEVLDEFNSFKVNQLVDLYNEDKHKARVKYFNTPSEFYKNRLVYFEFECGNFEYAFFRVKCGISVTNKMYFRETKTSSIGYKNGKFYYNNINVYRNLTYTFLKQFSNNGVILNKLIEKYPWIRTLGENTWTQNLSFNTIKNNSLYTLTDIKKHYFKYPLPVINQLISSEFFKLNSYGNSGFTFIKDRLRYLENITSLTKEFLDNEYFSDTCNMAKILGRKVNCKWSEKRLINEHNQWSKEISNILLSSEKEQKLNVNKIFTQFSEYSGYRLLTTNLELLQEGMIMKHCVGTYINKVNDGHSGIYHIEGHTLELSYYGNDLYMVQFKGRFNAQSPKELTDEVTKKLSEFNKEHKKDDKNILNNVENAFESIFEGLF
jgi:hypothetical protein